MAKSRNSRRSDLRRTSRHDIRIELDDLVRDIEYCRLENIRFEPDYNYFQFRDGIWFADYNNFPIDDDEILDIMIIVTGNTGTNPIMRVRIDNRPPRDYPAYEPFSENGRTFFSNNIPV